MLVSNQSQQIIIQSEHIGMPLIVDNARVITSGFVSMIHNMALILPRACNLITHGIADTFRTACRCKSKIIL